jgi:hypothetical protein
MNTATLRLLAAAAHECWCDRMRDQGWRPGRGYDAGAKVHDAIAPFDHLAAPDQRRTLRSLRCEDAAAYLGELLDYPRGLPGLPELQPEDMKIGREVVHIDDPAADTTTPGLRGKILSWVINPDTGDLDIVRVRWSDGSESEHTPPERELMLPAESSPPPAP